MDLRELRNHAATQLEALPEGDFMVLVMDGSVRPPKGFPRGETLCCPTEGGVTKRFKASAVLAWCDRELARAARAKLRAMCCKAREIGRGDGVGIHVVVSVDDLLAAIGEEEK